jgi:hypothetical protein
MQCVYARFFTRYVTSRCRDLCGVFVQPALARSWSWRSGCTRLQVSRRRCGRHSHQADETVEQVFDDQ